MQQIEVIYDQGVFQQCFKMLMEDTYLVQVKVAFVFIIAPDKLNENLNRKLVDVGLIYAYI